jgi:hypothetical protein
VSTLPAPSCQAAWRATAHRGLVWASWAALQLSALVALIKDRNKAIASTFMQLSASAVVQTACGHLGMAACPPSRAAENARVNFYCVYGLA